MLYRHYKGALYRTILDSVIHTETNDVMVVYMSVDTGIVYVRPSEMFHELVTTESGAIVPRFMEIGD